jgi:hypothetical protein
MKYFGFDGTVTPRTVSMESAKVLVPHSLNAEPDPLILNDEEYGPTPLILVILMQKYVKLFVIIISYGTCPSQTESKKLFS